MARIKIYVTDEPRKDLRQILVGRGSVLEADILGVPDSARDVKFHISKINQEGEEEWVVFHCEQMDVASYQVYANGFAFPEVGRVKYQITFIDDKGGSHWLGQGFIKVLPSVLYVNATSIVPKDTYLRNPETGLWHKLTVVLEDGVLTPTIEEEGIKR